jgi:hypothetical protein
VNKNNMFFGEQKPFYGSKACASSNLWCGGGSDSNGHHLLQICPKHNRRARSGPRMLIAARFGQASSCLLANWKPPLKD